MSGCVAILSREAIGRVYLAGPMSGIPHHNTPAFDAAAQRLRSLGHEVVSPPDITRANPQPGIHSDGTISDAAYRELVRLDLAGLLECKAVALLPGWQRSVGARREVAIAQWLGFPVFLAADLIERGADARRLPIVVSLLCEEGLESIAVPPDATAAASDPSRVLLGQASV